LAEASRACGGELALVHGGGRAVDLHLARLGISSERREGIRITTEEQIDEIVGVLAGRVNKALVGAIQAATALRAVGLCLGDGRLLESVKHDGFAFDPGRVGRVSGGDAALVSLLMRSGYLPVLSTIGLDAAGRALNINGDDGAAGLARALSARALVLLTDVPGVLDAERRLIARLPAGEIAGLVERGVIHGGMIPKVRAAVEAARAARIPATIASWNDPDDLARLARGEPVGTLVMPD
ncbi:MAG: acetylglutamate kinase, partial [Phycisphaerales bacterium]